jgi:acylphosphatase
MGKGQAHVWITGRVQGVFFRYHTRDEALRRGLKGWVRNLPDGRVEALFQGDDAAVEDMVRWCHQGPSSARVTNVIAVREDPDPELSGFQIRYG